MIHEYTEDEMVTITRKNYDEIKDGYDSGYKMASDETLEVIEDLEDRNEKLKSAVCIVQLGNDGEQYYRKEGKIGVFKDYKVRHIIGKESEFYPVVRHYFDSNSQLTKDLKTVESRITNFQNSFIGKLLNFFGVKL